MPGWHAKTKQLVQDRKLLVLGIAPEQHGDRLALFLQWKQMEGMTVMLDSYNLLGLRAVPITLLIDESGVVRYKNPKPADLETFLNTPPAGVGTAPKAPRPEAWIDHVQLFGGHHELLKGVSELDRFARNGTKSATLSFQRGVAARRLYDAEGQRFASHFESAVTSWRTALELDPNNYIYRRRLQQYGPRLDKPYPFYDWIEAARKDITVRGEEPVKLLAEPGGAELAKPLGKDAAGTPVAKIPQPDPDNQLFRDVMSIVEVTTILVPHTKAPKDAMRVYVTLTPNPKMTAKWNDEAGLSTLHLSPPEGWSASDSALILAPPKGDQDPALAPRRIEFDLRRDKPAGGGDKLTEVSFQLFYNVCFGGDRICQFMRREVRIPVTPDPHAKLQELPLSDPNLPPGTNSPGILRPRGW